jgi:hypothetical protein
MAGGAAQAEIALGLLSEVLQQHRPLTGRGMCVRLHALELLVGDMPTQFQLLPRDWELLRGQPGQQ